MPSALQLSDSNENFLINGSFQVAQLGIAFNAVTTPANSDDTYLLDGWNLLSDGNDIVDVTQDEIDVPEGVGTALELEVATANKKFGIIQFIEGKKTLNVFEDIVSLSFEAKKDSGNANLDTLRAAILSWSGTEDSLTSDVVNAWNAEGADPTLVANWSYENTPSDLTLTDDYQLFTIEQVLINTAGTTNIAVFIWCDNTDSNVTDSFEISKVKLEVTSQATTYHPVPFDIDLAQCQRFLAKSFDYETVPAQNVGTDTGETVIPAIQAGASTNRSQTVQFPVQMLKSPNSITLYNPAAANAQARDETAGADCTSTATANESARGFDFACTGDGGTSVGNILGLHWLADATL